ncbi:MAG: formylmethanofuran dehydrogenase subunit E family protein [Verrucomicrobiota bacterium]
MNKIAALVLSLLALSAPWAQAHETNAPAGPGPWNAAQEPTNWWAEIKQAHGHVGPWNVLGWRMGKAALRELDATWGRHELDIVCIIPMRTPYSCVADGLVVGTGNSIGRLDIRLSETFSMADLHASVRRKDGAGPVLLLKPSAAWLRRIRHAPDSELDALAHECGEMPEKDLFEIIKVERSDN